MKIKEIHTVCFVGAGTMGCFNSLLAALGGYQATLYDLSLQSFEKVAENHREMAGFLIQSGFCSAADIEQALPLIHCETDMVAATVNADLVSESIFERLDVKRDLHQQLEKLCPAHCILTTNTSALMVSDIESVLADGERFAALHSHLGATLIDIVAGPRSSQHTVDVLERYVTSINATPLILKKENPGYVLNAILGPLLTISMMLVIEDIATLEDVDRAWIKYRQGPMGPFGMMDLFGLDVVIDSWQQPKIDETMEKLKGKIIGFISPYIEAQSLGMKSKQGFYQYPQPNYEQPGFLETTKDLSGLDSILVSCLIENAVLIAQKGVADPVDIDRAWITATYLDTGPFGLLDSIGVQAFIERHGQLVSAGFFSSHAFVKIQGYLQNGSVNHA